MVAIQQLAQHSSLSNERYTPSAIAEATRELFGGRIMFDPASSKTANEVIKAEIALTKKDNGLEGEWRVKNMFLNPPGGSMTVKHDSSQEDIDAVMRDRKYLAGLPWYHGGVSRQAIWWDKLVWCYEKGYVQEAVFLSFSLELIGKRSNLLHYPTCFTSAGAKSNCVNGMGRIKFLDESLTELGQPTHCCLLVYLPKRTEAGTVDLSRVADFYRLFDQFGRCGWHVYA